MVHLVEVPVTDWYCPECKATDRTRVAGPHDRFHVCPKLRYLSTPMLRVGVDARIRVHEPEDYVRDELVQRDPERGRPVMSMSTDRPDGSNDLIVYAPTARAISTQG